MDEVGYLSCYDEKEYWLNQVDTLAVLKLRRLYNLEIEEDEYTLCSRPGDGHVITLFRKTMAQILHPYGYVHPYEDNTPPDTILEITFCFKDGLTDEEVKHLENLKKLLSSSFDDLSFEYYDEWIEDRFYIRSEYFVGYGIAGIEFMENFEKLKPYLKEVPTDVINHDRTPSGEAAAADH